jgi:hypothetical protein
VAEAAWADPMRAKASKKVRKFRRILAECFSIFSGLHEAWKRPAKVMDRVGFVIKGSLRQGHGPLLN